MTIVWMLAAFTFFLARAYDPESVRFELKTYTKYAAWIAALTVYRYISLTRSSMTPADINFPFEINWYPPFELGMVWWEDVAFVLPYVIMIRKNVSKIIWVPLLMLSSIVFASGHLYQGYLWSVITLFYPALMTMLARERGLATTAACHITYDILTYLAVAAWILGR